MLIQQCLGNYFNAAIIKTIMFITLIIIDAALYRFDKIGNRLANANIPVIITDWDTECLYRPLTPRNEMSSMTKKPTPSPVLPWIVAVGFFMQMLDGTILNTALPGMAQLFGVAPLKMQAVVISYLLTTALIIPACGWVADRFGPKRIFIVAVFIFTLGSLLCALSPSLTFLVAARVVQGLGGALMVPTGRLIAIRSYPRSQMVQILSFITVPGLIGPLLGPTAGGFLVQYASWHWIFLINVPVGIIGGLLALKYMPAIPADPQVKRFDTSGFLLFGGAMVLISVAMEGLGELHLPKVQATLLCTVGLGLLGLYWLRATHIPDPLFSPGLFKTRAFSVGILGNLFARLGSGAMPFLLPLFFQLVLGFSPFKSGMTMIPSAVASFAGKSLVPRLLKRFGFRRFLLCNTLLIGIMIACFSLIRHDTPYPLLLLQLLIFGTFNSMQFTAMNTVTLIDLSDTHTSAGNGFLSVTMQIASVCGVAVGAALLNGFSYQNGTHTEGLELQTAFKWTFICVGGLAGLTSTIFGQLSPNTGEAARSRRIKAKEAPEVQAE